MGISSPANTAERTTPSAAHNQAHVLQVVQGALSESFETQVCALTPVRVHQRVYSRVVDCRAELADGRRRHVMVKIYEPLPGTPRETLEKRIWDDFQINAQLHKVLEPYPRFLVPIPLFHSVEDLVIVTERMDGQQLQEKLVEQAAWFVPERRLQTLEADCRACGEWLRQFQTATAEWVVGNADFSAMRGLIADRLEWTVDAPKMPLNDDGRAAILAHFDRVVARLGPDDRRVCGVHGDYFPGNVLVDGDRVVGLDFAMYRVDSVFSDPSYFWFQLQTLALKPRFRPAVVTRLQRAFLSGYNPDWVSDDLFAVHPVLGLYEIFHLAMRLAGILARKDSSVPRGIYNRMLAGQVIRRLRHIVGG